MPKTIDEIRLLPCVDLGQGVGLPDRPGIYFVCGGDQVLYIGKAGSMQKRWEGGHHRALEMVVSGLSPMGVWWLEIEGASALDDAEALLVGTFRPMLNKHMPGSQVKNRSLRLDDENYGWLSGLPGRTLNDALTDYRASLEGPNVPGPLAELHERIERVGGQLSAQIEDLPDDDRIADVMRTVIAEVRGQRGQSQRSTEVSAGDPAAIPGVVRGAQNLPTLEPKYLRPDGKAMNFFERKEVDKQEHLAKTRAESTSSEPGGIDFGHDWGA